MCRKFSIDGRKDLQIVSGKRLISITYKEIL